MSTAARCAQRRAHRRTSISHNSATLFPDILVGSDLGARHPTFADYQSFINTQAAPGTVNFTSGTFDTTNTLNGHASLSLPLGTADGRGFSMPMLGVSKTRLWGRWMMKLDAAATIGDSLIGPSMWTDDQYVVGGMPQPNTTSASKYLFFGGIGTGSAFTTDITLMKAGFTSMIVQMDTLANSIKLWVGGVLRGTFTFDLSSGTLGPLRQIDPLWVQQLSLGAAASGTLYVGLYEFIDGDRYRDPYRLLVT